MFIDITPAPRFTGLEGLDDRMFGGVKMFSCVPVGGVVTTAHVAANQTNTEMDPPTADFQALFTALGARCNFLDLTYMGAVHCKFLGWDLAGVLPKFHKDTVGDCSEEASGIWADHYFPRDNRLAAKRAFAIVYLGDPPFINC